MPGSNFRFGINAKATARYRFGRQRRKTFS